MSEDAISPGDIVYIYESKNGKILTGVCFEKVIRHTKTGSSSSHVIKMSTGIQLTLENLDTDSHFWSKSSESFVSRILDSVKQKIEASITKQTKSLLAGENDSESDNLTCAKTTRSP